MSKALIVDYLHGLSFQPALTSDTCTAQRMSNPIEGIGRIPRPVVRCLTVPSAGYMIALLLLLLAIPPAAPAATPEIGVIYPDVNEPYIRVFRDIVVGIESAHTGRVRKYLLEKKDGLVGVEAWLKKRDISNVIVLGNRAMELARGLTGNYHIVAGAVLSVPDHGADSISAITLAPDPDLLFAQLKQLAPAVETVVVIYQADLHARIIDRAASVAPAHGLVLKSVRAETVRDGANYYREVLQGQHSKQSAIWLLRGDAALQERSVLHMVLKEAWKQKLLVFSSNPTYVKSGVLFSLYPDNINLGKSLASAVMELRDGQVIGVLPNRDLLSVVNTRTAEHLGLVISRAQQRRFDIVFPNR